MVFYNKNVTYWRTAPQSPIDICGDDTTPCAIYTVITSHIGIITIP